MSSATPTRPPERGLKRKAGLVLLGIGVLVALALSVSQASFNLAFLRPITNEQVFILVALSAVIFLLLLALSFMLVRNLLKLYAERRLGVLGSKFRTRMVVGALLLSLVPVLFLFLFAYGLMNRSIDKWFSGPVEELSQHAEKASDLLANYAADNARAEAKAIAASPDVQRSFTTGNFSAVVAEFHRHGATLQGGFALAIQDDYSVASVNAPEAWATLRSKLPATDGTRPNRLTLNGKTFMLGSARVGDNGRIVVAMPIPEGFSNTLREIEDSQRRYYELAQQRRLIRRTYMGLLLLITILVLFATTWFALFLAKLVTRPVAALAEATEEISRGRFDYRIAVPAADELGQLVTSFNEMAAQLESSSRKLADANVEIDQRRRQTEAILESIPTGVLSLDAQRRVTHTNPAFNRLFGAHNGGGVQFAPGSSLRDIFTEDVVNDLTHMLRRADRMGSIASQLEVAVGRDKLNVSVTVAALGRGERAGYVLVFEDLSDLLKAQKQAAWREVARRVAHEIKNPLTPIALSAERIQRHLERGAQGDESSQAIMQGCAETISGAVETVRRLVDEFATLARFPAAQPEPSDLNAIVENALSMFEGRMNGVRLERHLGAELPKVLADPEAIKRVIANLVDNAMEATEDSLVKEVHVSTGVVGPKDVVELVVADTGHGVTRELKEKLFLPYFSTKRRGTGLGLAIVNRIVEDHHGSIRVEENSPVGARFIVELPVADGHPA